MITRRAVLSTAPAFLRGAQGSSRPNVIYIHSHDTGRYIQPYGHTVPTPNLQRFAEQGILFRHAFDAAPTCSPSRAALLCGQSAHSSGMLGLAHRGFRLADPKRHLASYMQSQGYETVLAGVQHEAVAPGRAALGYSAILPVKDTHGMNVSAAAIDFLKSQPKGPFFLACGYTETHREFPVPGPKEDARYTRPPAPLPDTPQTRADMAAFKASARVLDEAMGAVFEALERSSLAANTLVICTTDHGIAFPAMKCNLTAHGTGVILMMRGPRGFAGGKVSDALVSHVDLFPTICDVAGLSKPGWLEGRSMLPLLEGKEEIRDEAFAEINYHASYDPQRSVRTRRFNYVLRFDSRTAPNLPNCDDGLSKTYWMEQGWRGQVPAREQLYDLVFDPHERNNLATNPSHAKTLDDLQGRMRKWMKATGDPLLHGHVAAPKGARINDPAGTSPREKPQVLD